MFARLIAAMRTKSYARVKNAAKVEANGFQLAHLDPDRGGDQLLLGDEHLEVPLRVGLGEDLGVGRVRDLAVERDDVAAAVAERLERVAVRLARRDLLAQRRRSAARASRCLEHVRLALGSPASRRRRVMFRMPPSSSIAASGSSSAFPCQPSLFSTAFTPLPLTVLATITVGRPFVAAASV